MRFTFDGGMCGSFPGGSRGCLLVAALATAFLAFLAVLDSTEGEHWLYLLSVSFPKTEKAQRTISDLLGLSGTNGFAGETPYLLLPIKIVHPTPTCCQVFFVVRLSFWSGEPSTAGERGFLVLFGGW